MQFFLLKNVFTCYIFLLFCMHLSHDQLVLNLPRFLHCLINQFLRFTKLKTHNYHKINDDVKERCTDLPKLHQNVHTTHLIIIFSWQIMTCSDIYKLQNTYNNFVKSCQQYVKNKSIKKTIIADEAKKKTTSVYQYSCCCKSIL